MDIAAWLRSLGLEMRMARLDTGMAWAEDAPSRTRLKKCGRALRLAPLTCVNGSPQIFHKPTGVVSKQHGGGGKWEIFQPQTNASTGVSC